MLVADMVWCSEQARRRGGRRLFALLSAGNDGLSTLRKAPFLCLVPCIIRTVFADRAGTAMPRFSKQRRDLPLTGPAQRQGALLDVHCMQVAVRALVYPSQQSGRRVRFVVDKTALRPIS